MRGVCRICGPVSIVERARGVYRCENKHRDARHEHMLTRYGITAERYRALVEKQKSRCAICKEKTDVLHVDHCHKSKKVRGLLCGPCNRGLGLFYEDITRLESAVHYIKKRCLS